MMVATEISSEAQALIDARLDTIDRMLLGRVPRSERLGIVREVESQIHDLLADTGAEGPTREDVLVVLARLDPPEAYLGDEDLKASLRPERWPPAPATNRRSAAKVSAWLGTSGLALLLLGAPTLYLLSLALLGELGLVLVPVLLLGTLSAAIVAIVFGAQQRKHGMPAIVGLVTGSLTVFFSVCLGIGVLLILYGDLPV